MILDTSPEGDLQSYFFQRLKIDSHFSLKEMEKRPHSTILNLGSANCFTEMQLGLSAFPRPIKLIGVDLDTMTTTVPILQFLSNGSIEEVVEVILKSSDPAIINRGNADIIHNLYEALYQKIQTGSLGNNKLNFVHSSWKDIPQDFADFVSCLYPPTLADSGFILKRMADSLKSEGIGILRSERPDYFRNAVNHIKSFKNTLESTETIDLDFLEEFFSSGQPTSIYEAAFGQRYYELRFQKHGDQIIFDTAQHLPVSI